VDVGKAEQAESLKWPVPVLQSNLHGLLKGRLVTHGVLSAQQFPHIRNSSGIMKSSDPNTPIMVLRPPASC
jgi:hypothetical protein